MQGHQRSESRRVAVRNGVRRVLLLTGMTVVVSGACTRESAAANVDSWSATYATPWLTSNTDVSALMAAARGAPAPVCALAARAVGNLGWWGGSNDAPHTPLAGEQVTLRRRIDDADERDDARDADALLSSAEQQLLLNNLATDDRCVRELSVRLLAFDRRKVASTEITARLVERLSVADSSVREVVVFGLGLLARSSATLPLMSTLRDRAATVRANAAWALGRINDGRALRALMDITDDRNATVRAASVTALGQIDSATAIPTLMRVLQNDESPAVRRVAAWALGQLNAEDAGTALARTLRRDADASVREMCAWALGDIEVPEGLDALIDAVRSDRAVPVRETAAWALGEMRDTRAISALNAAVTSDASRGVRGTAAWALGQMDTREAPSGLLIALRDTDDGLRLKASWALSEIRDPQSVPALKTALARETHNDARRAQLRALLAAGERSEALLTDLLRSSDASIREAAVRGLAGRSRMDPWPWPWPRPRPFP